MPSAVSTPSGVSQVTLAVSFPGSAHLSFRLGHLILGGSMSIERANPTLGWMHLYDLHYRKHVAKLMSLTRSMNNLVL